MRAIYFDTETSGLDCRDCKIIELAMLTVEDGEIIERYNEFIDIGQPIAKNITDLTGITNADLKKGIEEEAAALDLKKRLTEGTFMIAHNCQFDLSFVFHLLARHFGEEAYEIVSSLKWIDTLTVLKDRKDYPHTLKDAVGHYNINEVNFHRAIDDTEALYDVTQAMKAERNDLKEYENVFGFNPKWGVSGMRFPFIEYKPQRYHNCGLLPENMILPKK